MFGIRKLFSLLHWNNVRVLFKIYWVVKKCQTKFCFSGSSQAFTTFWKSLCSLGINRFCRSLCKTLTTFITISSRYYNFISRQWHTVAVRTASAFYASRYRVLFLPSSFPCSVRFMPSSAWNLTARGPFGLVFPFPPKQTWTAGSFIKNNNFR